MHTFERNRERGVIVLNDIDKVCGFLSMGDILEALAFGKSMYSYIEQIYNPSFLYLKEKDYKDALRIFKERNISLIQILNQEMRLVDVITARDLFGMVELR